MLGIVKWFKEDVGYGFIVDKTGKNWFVHYTGILSEEKFKKLYPLQMVDFEQSSNEKGPTAINVCKADVSDDIRKEYIDILVANGYDIEVANKRLEKVKKRDKFYKGGNKNEYTAEKTD